MKADGCGGHGINPDGLNPRDESCEWCRRWEWEPMSMRVREVMREAFCAATYCRKHGHHDDDGDYDATKHDWRTSGQMLDDLKAAGFWIVAAPPCKCGAAIGDRIHMDITDSVMKDGSLIRGPADPNQHPFNPA